MRIFKSKALMGEDRIGIQKARPVQPLKEHTHDYIEISYTRRGTAIERVDGTDYRVRRGDVIFMTPGSVHSFTPCEDFEYVEIFFSPHLIGEEVITTGHTLALLALTSFDNFRNDKSYGLVRFEGEDIHDIEWILDLMQNEFINKKDGYEAFMCNCLNMLLIKMVRSSAAGNPEGDVWRAIEEYIDTNSGKKITLSSLASKCFYNPSYFSRIFKQRYGMTLTDYLKKKRIERAEEILSNGGMTVDEVMRQVGFSDRSAFYSAFCAITGSTPSEYRKNTKSKNTIHKSKN